MITRNKIALALFVGLGPIFIMPLLLDQPKNLFQCWLLYGISTLFSLAGLYVMVYLAMDMTLAVAGGLFAGTNGWGLYSACQEEL
jgi:type IV secretion system protein VirB6